MIKYIIVLLLGAVLIASCHPKKEVLEVPVSTKSAPPTVKAVIHFDNCDSLRHFLNDIIVTNEEDDSIKDGYFKMRYLLSTYNDTKSLFPPECFIGITEDELQQILGKWKDEALVQSTPVKKALGWYYLDNKGKRFVIEVKIDNKIVTHFTAGPGYEVIATPNKKSN